MRGSHAGSFEVAHEMRDGKTWDRPESVDEPYDLVVVGGGISGLSAAYFFRKLHGERARVLVLDNHDDFGGHAKRNEFWHDGKMYLMNGGTLNVEAPAQYSTVAAGLLWELGIDRTRYYDSVAKVGELYRSLGLGYGVFFDRETFGADRLVSGYGKLPIREFLKSSPLSERAQSDLVRLYDGRKTICPVLGRKKARPRELPRLSRRRREGRSRRRPLPQLEADGSLLHRDRRGSCSLRVGDGISRLLRSRARADSPREASRRARRSSRPGERSPGGRGRPRHVLSRRERHHRASSRAGSPPESRPRALDGGRRHVTDRLRPSRSEREHGPHSSQ
jgi:hypothetical protein